MIFGKTKKRLDDIESRIDFGEANLNILSNKFYQWIDECGTEFQTKALTLASREFRKHKHAKT
jgi:hypothetical protein